MIITAEEFFTWQSSLGPYENWTGEQRTLRKKIFKDLPTQERYLVKRNGIEKFFVDENRSPDSPRGVPSPSGRYKLVVSKYATSPGSWGYSRGEVFRVSDGVRVADVKRNYSSFPHLWMESHHNGHDYLICGDDYQGQTFCELDTGRSKSHIPDAAFEGYGFCWGSYDLLSDGKTLLVNGCFWACPYEHRLYDVSDPMEGWFEYETSESLDSDGALSWELKDGLFIWSEGEKIFKETGERKSLIDSLTYKHSGERVKAIQAGDKELEAAALSKCAALDAKYPDEEDSPLLWGDIVDRRLTFKMGNHELILIDEWKSEHKMEQERRWKEYDEKSKADRLRWIHEGPLCIALAEKIGGIESVRSLMGFMYPSRNMRDEGDKNPAYFQLSARKYDPDKETNYSATIGWGVVEGPIIVELWIRGKGNISKPEFPRSPAGIIEAWEMAQVHLLAEAT